MIAEIRYTLSKKLIFPSNFRQNVLKSKSHILIEYAKIWFRFFHLKLELTKLKVRHSKMVIISMDQLMN